MAALKPRFLPFAILIISVAFYSFQASSAATLGGRKVPGGWQPIKDPADLSVVKIGKFAVEEQNQQPNATKLEFVSVVKGKTQVVAGLNYRLVIAAKDGGAKSVEPANYLAVVYEILGGKMLRLVSFKRLLQD